MTSLTDQREQVDVVIGVERSSPTPRRSWTARPAVSWMRSLEATTEGYDELVDFANNHATLRAWAIEGTSGHGAGLTRHLQENSEIVLEVDRPKRAARRKARSPTRWMRSQPDVKRWPDPGWDLPAPEAMAKHCPCCWLLAAWPSTPPKMPSCRSSAS